MFSWLGGELSTSGSKRTMKSHAKLWHINKLLHCETRQKKLSCKAFGRLKIIGLKSSLTSYSPSWSDLNVDN